MVTRTSGILGGYIYADRDWPSTQFLAFNVSESASPLGSRNIPGGSFAFRQIVGPHILNPLEFRNVIFDFATPNNISGLYQSTTECIIFRQTNDRFNISNMRFFMPSGTALTPSGHIEYATSGAWIYNAHIPSGYGAPVPTALPSTPNLRRCDGLGYLDGSDDIHVSQFIYMTITVPSGYSLGKYGYGGIGTLSFKLTFDIFQII